MSERNFFNVNIVSNERTFALAIQDTMTVQTLKEFVEYDTEVPFGEIYLEFKGKPLDNDDATVQSFGIGDNDFIKLFKSGPAQRSQ